ncbi:hypothetical protein E2C01_094627 [Portunus trituberculatus]|uniref:Uncharacterized protein n=1 Tax=Portunus trituberculatus TaxID=210409 RepID=A0A5B7JY54_PORTR|nr:hypothetical protein [Portunus trituberculatus]
MVVLDGALRELQVVVVVVVVVMVAAAVLRASRNGCPEGAKLVGSRQGTRRRQGEMESSFFFISIFSTTLTS